MLGLYMYSLLTGSGFPNFKIVGFVDDYLPQSQNHQNTGLRLVGCLKNLRLNNGLCPNKVDLVFAIGYKDMKARFAAFKAAQKLEYEFISIIHPNSIILEGSEIGYGSFVGPGTVLDVGCKIGVGNFIDAGCVIAESVKLGPGNYLSPKVVVCGHTSIGIGNFFGAATTLRDGLVVGNYNFLNMQTMLVRNLNNNTLVSETRNIIFLE